MGLFLLQDDGTSPYRVSAFQTNIFCRDFYILLCYGSKQELVSFPSFSPRDITDVDVNHTDITQNSYKNEAFCRTCLTT